MAMKRLGRGVLTACVAAGALASGSLAVGTLAQGDRRRAIEPARMWKTPPQVATRGQYPREERFVRDVYARVMRYDLAAREFKRIETGDAAAAGGYLNIALSGIRTEEGAAAAVPQRGAAAVAIARRTLCEGDDPCHVYYDVSWARDPASRGPVEQRGTADVTRHTTYTVTLTLGAATRTYKAVALFHDDADGLGATAEVIDPMIPDLGVLAGDRAPLAKAPWNTYIRTRRYAVVTESARAWQNNAEARAASVPAGYVIGDEVTTQQEMAVTMSGSPCSTECDCSTRLNDAEWTHLRSAFPRLIREHTCKLGPATSTYNCLAWTIDDTSRWWWREADTNSNSLIDVTELNNFYQARGKTNIAYYGRSTTDVLHVAKKSGGNGTACQASSKLGENIRMAHDLNELAGGTEYGNIVGGR